MYPNLSQVLHFGEIFYILDVIYLRYDFFTCIHLRNEI